MATEAAAEHSALSAIWTFPSILASAFVLAAGKAPRAWTGMRNTLSLRFAPPPEG